MTKQFKYLLLSTLFYFFLFINGFCQNSNDVFNGHPVKLDDQNKIISWISPQSIAYDQFLRQRWNYIKTRVSYSPGPSPRSLYPEYYFYCGFWVKNDKTEPDKWMNDVGEKIPNWVESALLYYAYTGDTSVMNIVQKLASYAITHGTSPDSFAWPDFPYTTTNAGDTLFRGFTTAHRFVLHEIQVDHAGDMGLAYYRLWLYTGDEKFKKAALSIANTLSAKIRPGTLTHSPWPYLVIMDSGKVVSEYCTNWTGCYALLKSLADAGLGNVQTYRSACEKVRDFILDYPLKTGYWTDGHTDNDIRSHTYKSNLSASNFTLYLFDHPEFDPDWKTDIPKLIKWSEDNFVYRCEPGEPATQWGANLLGEQDTVLIKMDYQTARYGAECARWYALSGDESYKEKAFRSLNWVTYCNDSAGRALESPVSKPLIASNWYSDEYGECPRMFYHAFAALPEWAPPHENHILYSEAVLKNVSYMDKKVSYYATVHSGIDYLRLNFEPVKITLNGIRLTQSNDLTKKGYTLRNLGNGDYALKVRRMQLGDVTISGY